MAFEFSTSSDRPGFSIQKFPFENVYAKQEEGKQQGTEYDTDKSEQGKSYDHAEDGNKRVCVGYFFLENEPGEVIYVDDDKEGIDCQYNGFSPTTGDE